MSENTAEQAWRAIWRYVREFKLNREHEARAVIDALLAEHRAEVEASEAERKKLADRLERAVKNVDTIASASRDAALEEAKDAARVAHPPENVTLSGRDKVVLNMGVRAAVARIDAHRSDTAARIRAMKSQPARQYVDAEKVREVLAYYAGADVWNRSDLLDGVARALSLNLSSADPES